MKFLPNPIEEWDRDESFKMKPLDVIIDNLRWMGDKYPSNIKPLRETKGRFYEEMLHGR